MNNHNHKIKINKVLHLNSDDNNTAVLLNKTPALFNKKSHKIILKPSVYIKADTGITRHFTPAAQE
jgi:hypothetical protein